MSTVNRRAFLVRSAALGCSVAASPLVTPVSFAATPGAQRLVVIVLRGGMDGLSAIIPYGDPDHAAWRGDPAFGDEGALDLDGFFAMNAGLRGLSGLWDARQLGFVHAVSTPYRDKRSHFDGQDMLEAGISGGSVGMSRDGWLNRLVQTLPNATTQTAYAIGNDPLAILNGPAPVRRWSPEADLVLSPQAIRLARLVMQDDPAMAQALETAYALAEEDGDPLALEGGPHQMMTEMRNDMDAARGQSAVVRMAEFTAKQLREEARIASFSINGWDTHAHQEWALSRALESLSAAILTLQSELGAQRWAQTTVVAVTEFGRTVRVNGTRGTDHGTGGAMILAGGAVHGGRVVTDWPGLSEADLFERRDLRPTRDVRAHLGWILRGQFGLSRAEVTDTVFPGVDLGADPGLLL